MERRSDTRKDLAEPVHRFYSIRALRDWLNAPVSHEGSVVLAKVPGAPYGGVWDDAYQAEVWLRDFLGGLL